MALWVLLHCLSALWPRLQTLLGWLLIHVLALWSLLVELSTEGCSLNFVERDTPTASSRSHLMHLSLQATLKFNRTQSRCHYCHRRNEWLLMPGPSSAALPASSGCVPEGG